MTKHEFEDWINYHVQAFPKLGEDFSAGVRNPSQWYNALRRVRQKDAMLATDELMTNVSAPRYDGHCGFIKDFAKKHGGLEGENPPPKRVIGGARVFTCHHCQDTGHTLIFAPEAMSGMRDGRFGWLASHAVVACACDCEWGRRVGEAQKLLVFSAQCMVRAVCGHDKPSVAALAAFFQVSPPEVTCPVQDRPAAPVVDCKPPPPTAGELLRLEHLAKERREGAPLPDEREAPCEEGPWSEEMDIAF